jgi:hypothetical protein
MQRYRYKMLRTEEADGHPCWVIGFEPKEGKLPVDEIMDHALNDAPGCYGLPGRIMALCGWIL